MDADRDMCRRAAAQCIALARMTTDPAKKETLLIRAQEWIKLAYARSEDQFAEHVAALNETQMQRQPAQQQPAQQQQGKNE
jgi:hypothetical protein